MAEWYSRICLDCILSIQSSVDPFINCFYLHLQIFAWVPFLNSFEYTWSRIARSCSNSIFNFLKNSYTTPASFYIPTITMSNFSTSAPTLVTIYLLFIAILVGMKWNCFVAIFPKQNQSGCYVENRLYRQEWKL